MPPNAADVAFGDPILGEPDTLIAEDVLSCAGITPPTLRLYPVETHLAEKLHAYTMPRARPNSRVKDLPDLALLASAQPIDAKRLRAALEPDYVAIGGGNASLLEKLPDGVETCPNENAFVGGFRLWGGAKSATV